MGQNYGLGRGLSSLIPQKKINRDDDNGIKSGSSEEVTKSGLISTATPSDKKEQQVFSQGILEVEIDKILVNPYQPRISFDEAKLKELADSIKEHGILQPLVVTKNGEGYELIAGERRLQAAKLAALERVPVIVKDVKDKQKLELAIVENIQRHNLNPIEEAKSFQQLISEFGMNQEEVAQKMGKSRSVVANKVRLLKLPIEAIKALKDGIITEGHAKVILSLDNPEKQRGFLDLIIKGQWTVRQAENKIKEISDQNQRRIKSVDPMIKEIEDKLAVVMGTKVKVTKSGAEGGKIIIDYYSSDELNKIINNLSSENKNIPEEPSVNIDDNNQSFDMGKIGNSLDESGFNEIEIEKEEGLE